jgi:cell division protein FtsN
MNLRKAGSGASKRSGHRWEAVAGTRRRSGSLKKGGFAVGLVVGLLIGLALALGVALYVTKVPVPFINKVPQRTAEQDAAEAERNKNWDPNAPLGGKPAARGAGPVAGTAAATAKAPGLPAIEPTPATPASRPAAAATLPAASSAKTARAGSDPLIYYAQAGAYSRSDDAEAQRAKLALLGVDAKVTERDQSGRTVYRVRTGPFDTRAQAEAMLDKLQAAGVESSLVRVGRQ